MAIIARHSQDITDRAKRFLPGGVSGADRLLDPNLVFTRAEGAYVVDAEGRRYIDYHLGYGSAILGHCHPMVNQRITEVIAQIDLVSVGTNELEIALARKVVESVPSAEKVIFCNSGSEATYVAIRLARAATGRRKLVKFQGCYHGWHDAVLVNVLTPADKINQIDPGSAGMTPEVVEDTIILPFNDMERFTRIMHEQGETIAAVILEPIPHFAGCILPRLDFLHCLRKLTREYGIILIFDEIISGFRHSLGGYQKVVGVNPDLTTVGKAMGNGYPLAALCGTAKLMDHLGPEGDTDYTGTYNAHPVSVAAGLATLEILEQPSSYNHIFSLGERMRRGLSEILERVGVEATVTGFGSIFVVYFMSPPINQYTDLLRNDYGKYMAYRHGMIERGVYELPRYQKRNHISLSHTVEDIDQTLEVAELVFRKIR